MEDYTYKTALEELRSRYNDRKVSAFIGAGFSKNVYKGYPSWDELLFDMVYELYETEISQSYKEYYAHSLKYLDKVTLSEHRKEQVNQIMKRMGYLNIISQYIEKKGFREALEVYIEKRIPSVSKENNAIKLYSPYEDKKHLVSAEDFRVHRRLLSGNWNSFYTTNYDRLIEVAAEIENKSIKAITQAYELELDNTKPTLIKLHGSFPGTSKEEEVFEFDGSHHHKYIMTKEDYDTYPTEHEAFTQLMRISLLQGTFCLFGFSGEDPNFINWIKWVRDILVRYRHKSQKAHPQRLKIFLFEVSDKEPSSERILFYKNHNIYHIPLLSQSVKSIINCDKNESDIRKIFLALFDFLDSTNNIPIHSGRHYIDLWAECIINPSKVQDLLAIKPNKRIVVEIYQQEKCIDKLKDKTALTSEEIDLFILSLQDTFYLPSFWSKTTKIINSSRLRDEQKIKLENLIERNTTIEKPLELTVKKEYLSDDLSYEICLRMAFSLSFGKLKKHLKKWQPQKGIYTVKKSLFLSLFDREKAKMDLEEYITKEPILQERYFGMEQLRLIDILNRHAESYYREKNQGVDNFYKLKESFFDINKKQEDITPYGIHRNTYGLDNSDTNNFSRAFRALQFLIELPLFTYYPNIKIVSQTSWLSVFKPLFEKYPYPCLFYSSLYRENNFLSRIGQEYAFSDTLYESKKVDRILKVMLNSILDEDIPPQISKSLMILSSELFISVPTKVWQATVLKIWKKKIHPHYKDLLKYDFEPFKKFIIKAISKIKDKSILEKFAIEFLSYTDTEKPVLVSDLFFCYMHEIRKIKSSEVSTKLKNKLTLFVKDISTPEEITVAYKIKNLFTVKDTDLIVTKAQEFLIKEVPLEEAELLSISKWFRDDIHQQEVLKNRIINHPKLWETGVMENGRRRGPISPIELQHFEGYISWKESEIREIFDKLKIRLEELTRYYQDKETIDHIFNTLIHENALLMEMESFLTRHQDVLKDTSNYEDTLKRVRAYLIQNIDSIDIQNVLLSDNEEHLDYALYQICNELNLRNEITNIEKLDMIIYRILYKKEQKLLVFLQILSFTIENKLKTKSSFERFSNNILSILNTYKHEDLFDLNLNIYETTKTFIKIAENLRDRGLSSDGIDYWLGRKDRFNFTWN